MAEKEERYISITQMVAKENIETEKYRVMPRQEAIERMAKAFWPWNYTPSEIQSGKGWKTMTEWERGGWLGLANAALNALLGDK